MELNQCLETKKQSGELLPKKEQLLCSNIELRVKDELVITCGGAI